MLKKHFRIWWIQGLNTFFHHGFAVLLYLYFVKESISFAELILAKAVSVLVVIIYLLFRGYFHSRKSIVTSFLLLAASMLLFFTSIDVHIILYIYFVVDFLGTIIFYTPYNILFFKDANKDKHLQEMTWYWGVSIVTAVVGPIVGAYIFAGFGLNVFLIVSLLIVAFALYLTRFIKSEEYRYTLKQSLQYLKGLRTVNLIDGALHKVKFVIIPVFSLKYIQTETDYGLFLSLISLVALFFAFEMAKFSDKRKKRTIFIWPLSIAAGIVTGLFYFVNTFFWFMVLAVILQALTVLVEPIRSNIIQDKKEKKPITWISREVYLNIGRVILLVFVALLLFYDLEKYVFVLLGLLHISFPVVLHLKKVYAAAH